MIDDEQGCFRAERECIDQIFMLKQIGEKACHKACVKVKVGESEWFRIVG